MLALRLARGARPAVQLRRLLVALASGGTGFLLLCALGYALGHPQQPGTAAVRLGWCLVPLAGTADFAVAVARGDPGTRPRPGIFAAGLGPVRLAAFATLTTVLSGLIGSALALVAFLHLRGDLVDLPLAGAAGGLLAAGRPLPVAALVLLLVVTPLVSGVTVALALRPGGRPASARPPEVLDDLERPAPAGRRAAGLAWGVALCVAGLAVETSVDGPVRGAAKLTLPQEVAGGSPRVLTGWVLTACGLALAGPALAFACGRLLRTARPNGVRLLAGRLLQQEAGRVGRPLGVLCAVASGVYAAAVLPVGPTAGGGALALGGALLVVGCAVGTLAMAAVEARRSRARTTAALLRLGAPAGTLRIAAALRAGALLVLFGPLTWGVAALVALPLGG